MLLQNTVDKISLIDTLSIIGTIFSIAGVGITIFLTISTNNIKEKMKIIGQIETLKKDKKTLINELKSCQDLIESDMEKGITDLSRVLRQIDEYKELLTKEDLNNLNTLKGMINGSTSRNKERILICISSLIGFLELNRNNNLTTL